MTLALARAAAAEPAQSTTSGPADVLAVIAGEELTRAELEELYSRSPQALREEGRRKYLEKTVDFRALLALGRSRGYDGSAAVLARVRPRLRESLARVLFVHEKARETEVTTRSLRQLYEDRKALLVEPESLQVSELECSSEADCRGFKLVIERSGGIEGLGQPLRGRVKDLGKLVPGSVPLELWELLKRLEPGGVSGPLETDRGWKAYVVRSKQSERQRTFEEIEPALRAQAEAARDQRVAARLLARCRETAPVELFAGRLQEPEAGTVLARVGEREITRRELLEEVQAADPVQRAYFTSPAGSRALLERIAQRECLAQLAQSIPEIQQEYGTQLEYFQDREVVETLLSEECYRHVSVSEEEARRHYAANGGKYGRGRVDSSHILFSRRSTGPTERAEEALERLRAGEPFERLAREVSEDRATSAKDGRLGWFGQGMLVEPYEKAVFSLEPGQITSRPVESMYGAHVIQLHAVEPPRPFEQARDQVIADLTQQRKEAAYGDFVARARGEAAVITYPELLPPDPVPKKDPGMVSMQRITITSEGTIEVAPADEN